MTSLGPDPATQELQRVMAALAAGTSTSADDLEVKHVDLKEEAGRRGRDGVFTPSEPRNEQAAHALAIEAACMANTPGGGYLVVGVDNDCVVRGTLLETEWLRRRIYDLTQRELTVDATGVELGAQRVVVLRCPEALEPIRMNGKIRWRVDTSCMEVDASTWHQRRLVTIGFDWSAQASGLPVADARASAVDRARDFLRASQEERAVDLADCGDVELLTRLNVVTSEGLLTNAGVVAFVGRAEPALDYIRRETAGGDSVNRVRQPGRGLVEELSEVEQAIRLANPVRHLPDGLVSGQVRQLPPGAVRETIVNGCVHRDWNTAEPTLVEHDGATLVVTSPGGFIGGVTPENIITHPSQPRNRALTELFASLRVAEREGVGVDRMVREMVRVGHSAPVIQEVPGPRVRAALVGDIVDRGWITFLGQVGPSSVRNDLNSLLILRRLVDHWWVDASTAAPLLQRTPLEAQGAIDVLADAVVAGHPLIAEVQGVPDNAEQAWHLTGDAVAALAAADAAVGQRRRPVTREQVARSWAAARGRISTTELASIVTAHATNVGSVLKGLEARGELTPGREGTRGRGFFYRYVGGDSS